MDLDKEKPFVGEIGVGSGVGSGETGGGRRATDGSDDERAIGGEGLVGSKETSFDFAFTGKLDTHPGNHSHGAKHAPRNA